MDQPFERRECGHCGRIITREEAATSHSVMTEAGARSYHDVCALAAGVHVNWHEHRLMEDVVRIARRVGAFLIVEGHGDSAAAISLRHALMALDDYRGGRSN